MNYLKSYDSYSINESSSSIYRGILYAFHFLLSKIFKSEPLLNYKYNALKEISKNGCHDDVSAKVFQINEDIEKVKLSDLPNGSVKKGLYSIFNKWNIFKSVDKVPNISVFKRNDGYKNPLVDLFYISKDEISKNDFCTTKVLKSDDQVMVILVAKVDDHIDIKHLHDIEDRWTQLCDDYNVTMKNLKILGSNSYCCFDILPDSSFELTKKFIYDVQSYYKSSMSALNSVDTKEWGGHVNLIFKISVDPREISGSYNRISIDESGMDIFGSWKSHWVEEVEVEKIIDQIVDLSHYGCSLKKVDVIFSRKDHIPWNGSPRK